LLQINAAGYGRLQAEVSANAEKAASSSSTKARDLRKSQMALSMHLLKFGTQDKTKMTLRIEKDVL